MKQGLTLYATEMKEFFRHPRALHLVPLLLFAAFMMNWIAHIGPQYPVIIAAIVCGLELQFDNILFRSPNEYFILTVYPIDREILVLAKNLAAITITLFCLAASSAFLFYFSPVESAKREITEVILSFLVVVFPLLHVGNLRSIDNPRPQSGWRVRDFVETLWMGGSLAIALIPYLVFVYVIDFPLLCIVYSAGAGAFWYFTSIPKAVNRLGREQLLS
ncbi:MAG TPA: hypothetical protein VKS81_11425 [Bacteroidota bacterium]|nr:hypothetical protein [Bacteroidota bacterium]